MAITFGRPPCFLGSRSGQVEVMMKIRTMIIRIGAAAFVTAMAGKIVHVAIAHSQEAPASVPWGVGNEIPVFAAAAHLGDRRQLNHYVLGGSHDAANQAPNRGDIAKSIRAQNVDCPIVTSVSGRGRDAYGQVFRVRCGPVRGTSSDGFPYLSVTIQSNGEAVISPE